MSRLPVFAFLLMLFNSCSNNQSAPPAVKSGFDFQTFSKPYGAAQVPYELSDSVLLRNKDTSRIDPELLKPFIADSILKKMFGKITGIRFIPMQRLLSKKGDRYFITKAVSGVRTASLLTVFAKNSDTAVSMLFLAPDSDPATDQSTTLDNAYSVSKNIVRKTKDGVPAEGKEVYAYNAAENNFTLIMTDVLDEKPRDLINPIDTLPRKSKYAGDYVKDKKNIVSIRDGRTPKELTVFVHFEKEDGACTGELKGTLFLTSTTTAVYRQGSDPCVLDLIFSGNSVSLHEEEGCGSHRGLQCEFSGSYLRKVAPKPKAAPRKRTPNSK